MGLIAYRLAQPAAGLMSTWLVGEETDTELQLLNVVSVHESLDQNRRIILNAVTDIILTEGDAIHIQQAAISMSRNVDPESEMGKLYKRSIETLRANRAGLHVPLVEGVKN